MPNKKILLIDDEPEIVEMLELKFVRDGYDVKHAYSGEEGIEVSKEFKPDAIVLDITMPGMSGWDVCKTLRSQKEFASTRIVALTATRDFKAAKSSGIDRVLLKPYDYEEIILAIS